MSEKDMPSENIIVVDDKPNNLRLLVSILSEAGYHVRPSPNGKHALSAIKKSLPDLILLDILMPDLDGYEVCKILKKNESTRDIPVLFISGLDEIVNKTMGFELGAVDYITKPFNDREVLARVTNHLQINRLRKHLKNENHRLEIFAEAAFEGILIHDQGIIFMANSTIAELLKVGQDKLIGSELSKWFHPQGHSLLEMEEPNETLLLGKKNREIPVMIQSRSMNVGNKNARVTTIRDLSKQKIIEEENQKLQRENTALRVGTRDRFRFGDLVGKSDAMQEIYELIAKAASSDYRVIIYGESGTGKELVSRTIHKLSSRQRHNFIPVNCGAISEHLAEREFFGHCRGAFTNADREMPGYFEIADKGVLFLDEIGELSLPLQVKLLRVMETGEYTPVGGTTPRRSYARIIAATNRDLSQLVAEQKFRNDLYYGNLTAFK